MSEIASKKREGFITLEWRNGLMRHVHEERAGNS